jgi:rsbT co-antagonist protein RsbR
MREMGVTERNIGRRKHIVGLDAADLERLSAIRELMVKNRDEYADVFFHYLSTLDEARELMADPTFEQRVRTLKVDHIMDMAKGEFGLAYVEQRLELGLLYSRYKIAVSLYLGVVNQVMKQVYLSISRHFEQRPDLAPEHILSYKKIAFFDIGLIIDVLIWERERIIRQQQEAIRELSTPVLQIRDRLLLMPIIGVIDTQRARLLTESLLTRIRTLRARVVVMDVTGVVTIDSKVTNHLLQTIQAARLMGARVIVTGLSAEVALSLVTLGIDLSRINTVGDLQGGIEEAERLLGYRMIPQPEANVGGQPVVE